MSKINHKVGDTVYFYERWNGYIEKGIIEELKNCDGIACAEIRSICAVDKSGNSIGNTYGTKTRALCDVYLTCKEAFEAVKHKNDIKVQKYCEEIKTIKDLLTFPLLYCLNGGEYTDYAAKKAYKQRVKELFGFEFDYENYVFVSQEDKDIDVLNKEIDSEMDL